MDSRDFGTCTECCGCGCVQLARLRLANNATLSSLHHRPATFHTDVDRSVEITMQIPLCRCVRERAFQNLHNIQ